MVPSAVSVQSVVAAVPPLSLVTVLTSVKCAVLSSLLIVQVALSERQATERHPARPQSKLPAV